MKRYFKRFILGFLASMAAFCGPALSYAQEWPNKTIKFIVPYPPGGGTDAFARPLAAKLSSQLGQQVIVENRGGAGGTIGAEAAAKSPPDGYTFLVGAVHHALAPAVYKSLNYDLERDLTPVTGIAYVPDVLVVSPKVTAKNVGELVSASKANPGKLNYGSSGNGTTRHLSGEMFNNLTGSSIVHVPYKGSGPAMTALLGSEIDLIFVDMSSAAGQIRGGQIRALAVTSPTRSPTFPEVPTMAEAGVSGFEMLSWYGLWAPAGSPREIIAKMQSAVAKALAAPDIRNLWFQQGAEPGGEPPERFRKYVRSEVEKWAKAAKQNKITVD